MSPKSSSIQHRYRELSLEPQLLNGFANEDLGVLGGEHVSDEIQELFEKLAVRLVWIVDNMLTKRQAEIVRMIFLEQKTQSETGRILGLCQTSIHKSLNGNLVRWPNPKRYGGSIKKLQNICATDVEVQAILKTIEEIKKETGETT